jgi:hypothetical protein
MVWPGKSGTSAATERLAELDDEFIKRARSAWTEAVQWARRRPHHTGGLKCAALPFQR